MLKLTIEGQTISELRKNLHVIEQLLGTDNKPAVEFNATTGVMTPTLAAHKADETLSGLGTKTSDKGPMTFNLPTPTNGQAFTIALPKQETVQLPQVTTGTEKLDAVGDLDAEGVPWNPLYHSANKSKKTNGTWRTRRNLNEVDTPTTVAAPVVTAPAPTLKPMATPVVTPTLVTTPPVPTLNVVHALPSNPPLSGGHTLETFQANLITVMAGLINSGQIDKAYVASLCGYFQVKEIWEIFNQTEKVKELFENFVAAGLVVKAV